MQAPEIVRVLAAPLQLAFDLGWSEAAPLGVQGGAALSCRRPGTGGLLSVAAVGGQPRGAGNGRSSFVSHKKQYNIFLYPCQASSSRLVSSANRSPRASGRKRKAEGRRQKRRPSPTSFGGELPEQRALTNRPALPLLRLPLSSGGREAAIFRAGCAALARSCARCPPARYNRIGLIFVQDS